VRLSAPVVTCLAAVTACVQRQQKRPRTLATVAFKGCRAAQTAPGKMMALLRRVEYSLLCAEPCSYVRGWGNLERTLGK